jgi:hypothetical protein
MVSAISVNPNNPNEIYIGASLSGLFHTTDRGQHWECLSDHAEFPVLGVKEIIVNYEKNPHAIIMTGGANSFWFESVNYGIIKSNDGGRTWSKTYEDIKGSFTNMEFKGILQDSISKKLYAYSGKKILRSDDDGNTWQEIFSLENDTLKKYKEHGITDVVLNTKNHSLYLTLYIYPEKKDSVFSKESQLISIKNCEAELAKMNILNHTAALKEAYNTDDISGVLTIKITKPNNNSSILYVQQNYAKNASQVLYFFDMNYNQVANFVIPNSGVLAEDLTWYSGLQINPKNPAHMYLGATVFYTSSDSGRRFTPNYGYNYGDNNEPHVDIRKYLITKWSEDGVHDEIYLGTDGGLSFSNNSGKTFTNLNGSSLPITQFYGFDVSPFTSTMSAGAQDNSIFSYLPYEKKWIFVVRGDGYDVEYSKKFPGEAYGQYNSRVLRKTNNDVAPFDTPMRHELFEMASNKKTLQTLRNGDLYFAENKLHIYHRTSNTWSDYALPTPHATLGFQVAPSDSSIIYLSSYWNGLYKSIDGGKTFVEITQKIIVNNNYRGDGTRFHAICVHPDNPNKLWISRGYLGDYIDICKQTERVYYSEDGGNSWVDYSEGLPIYNVSDLVFLEGTKEGLFASTFEGIYFRENKNATWALYSNHFPKCVVPEMKVDYCRGKLVAITYGRGLWETDLPNCNYNDPLIIDKPSTWTTPSNKEALYVTRDIIIKRKGSLNIATTVHIAKGKSIFVKEKNKLAFTGQGKITNECHEEWGGVKKK